MLADAPPWTLEFLTANWDAMVKTVPSTWMPTELPKSKAAHRRLDELGCGHYGCVFPTNEPGLVLKLSSDPSEAEFVYDAMAIGSWPEGIVEYYEILELPGKYAERQIYAIWREEAHSVGGLSTYLMVNGLNRKRSYKFFDAWFTTYNNAASRIFRNADTLDKLARARQQQVAWAEAYVDQYKDQAWFLNEIVNRRLLTPFIFQGVKELAMALAICKLAVNRLADHPFMNKIGKALKFYWDHGLLLADLHFGNLGMVRRKGRWIWAITDPGHALRFRPTPITAGIVVDS